MTTFVACPVCETTTDAHGSYCPLSTAGQRVYVGVQSVERGALGEYLVRARNTRSVLGPVTHVTRSAVEAFALATVQS